MNSKLLLNLLPIRKCKFYFDQAIHFNLNEPHSPNSVKMSLFRNYYYIFCIQTCTINAISLAFLSVIGSVKLLLFYALAHTHTQSSLLFRLSLPVNDSGEFPAMRRQGSELFLEGALSPPCQRMGAMVAFHSFDHFKRCLQSFGFIKVTLFRKVKWLTKCTVWSDLWFDFIAGALMKWSVALWIRCVKVLCFLMAVPPSVMGRAVK